MANNCKVPTPRSYVTQMLNYIKYLKQLKGTIISEFLKIKMKLIN